MRYNSKKLHAPLRLRLFRLSAFDKFSRGAHAHLFNPNGSGLGLYIVKGIIDRAGGDVWIKSREGTGTVVTFTLPC